MKNQNYELLNEVIGKDLENLNQYEFGSDERKAATNDLATLYKLRLEESKILQDSEIKEKQLAEQIDRQTMEFENTKTIYEKDSQFREKQLSEQRDDRYLRVGLEIAAIVIPLMFYRRWMKDGFKFEETGTYTSTTFRGLINKFRPTR